MTASSSKSDPVGSNQAASDRTAARKAGLAVLVGGLLAALLTWMWQEQLHRFVFDQWQRSAPREIAADQVLSLIHI